MTLSPGGAVLLATGWGVHYRGRSFPCAIGRGGIVPAADKREGDGACPAGCWRLTHGWWRADRLARPRTSLPLIPAGPEAGWCDDPNDPAYNRPVRLPRTGSAEALRRADPLYDIVIATDHNQPPVPGMGSAIFMHCWRGPRIPTAGCLALRRDHLCWILARWTRFCRLVFRDAFSQT